jgi:hypothetical protein
MVYIFLCAAIGLFLIGIRVLGLVPRVKLVITASKQAVAVMKSPDMSEDEKEAAIQKAAVQMFVSFGSILIRTATVCLVPLAFILLFAKLGLYTTAEVYQGSTDIYFITVSTIVMILAFALMR